VFTNITVRVGKLEVWEPESSGRFLTSPDLSTDHDPASPLPLSCDCNQVRLYVCSLCDADPLNSCTRQTNTPSLSLLCDTDILNRSTRRPSGTLRKSSTTRRTVRLQPSARGPYTRCCLLASRKYELLLTDIFTDMISLRLSKSALANSRTSSPSRFTTTS
jgi:hypothetical protein